MAEHVIPDRTDPTEDGARRETYTARKTNFLSRLPHPIPYQGSKRNLAPQILKIIEGKRFQRFFEPFAGSAAMTIAAANAHVAQEYIIGDSLVPLIEIWQQILASPDRLANAYEILWKGQLAGDDEYYNRIREEYNRTHNPASLLYLLARCVKNAPRFNQRGEFNQSHDRRRSGMQPEKMRRAILGACTLLAGRTITVSGDFAQMVTAATENDIVYMDPPYEGTTVGTDKRYHQGLPRERLLAVLEDLKDRNIPYILSYDGRTGDKTYGEILPRSLNLQHFELHAGRSSQATLSGRDDVTYESLYISKSLLANSNLALISTPGRTVP